MVLGVNVGMQFHGVSGVYGSIWCPNPDFEHRSSVDSVLRAFSLRAARAQREEFLRLRPCRVDRCLLGALRMIRRALQGTLQGVLVSNQRRHQACCN